MLDRAKVSILNVAKSKLQLSENAYRDILNSFNVQSSVDLSEDQFFELMRIFKELGYSSSGRSKKSSYNRNTGINFPCFQPLAEETKIRIRDLWKTHSDGADENALEMFIYKILKKISLNILTHDEVEILIDAICTMKK